MKWGPSYPQGRDLSSLRLLGSVGEPINPEAWMWYHKYIGGERCPIVDTCGKRRPAIINVSGHRIGTASRFFLQVGKTGLLVVVIAQRQSISTERLQWSLEYFAESTCALSFP
jgi:hypothetical protein